LLSTSKRGAAIKVLIADDHAVVRRGLREILAAEQDMIVVGEAKDGHDALELARKLEWDVAVLDYSMPGRNGLELIKEIKRERPGRPVLILTMLPEEAHAAQVFKAGGAGYINKESANEELTAAIRKVVSGSKSNKYESLHVLTSSLCFDPSGERVAWLWHSRGHALSMAVPITRRR